MNVTITQADDGQRLDRWLKKNFPTLAFGQMQKILRTGQVRVDGKRAKGETRLATGQVLRLPPQLSNAEAAEGGPQPVSARDAAFIRSLVIYQDDDLIAINKPAGLATQGGSKITRHIDGMLDALRDGREERPHLVHRLDKDTSGVLLLARSAAAARAMGHIFSGRDIRKYYWAVTVASPMPRTGRISSTLAKGQGRGGERMMTVDDEDGKPALTLYHTIEALGEGLAWVAFWPRTGRTHQIRVHAAQIGCPLLGDEKYGDEEADDRLSHDLLPTTQGRPRLHLHARRVIFSHPRTGKTVDITAPLQGDMKATFAHLALDGADKTDYFMEQDI